MLPVVFTEALVRERQAELRRASRPRTVPRARRRNRLMRAGRHGLGYLLIELGARLAVERQPQPVTARSRS
ncbi:MAG: hypothetical protein ACRDN9_12340 [Streptosporangiaceae bacterium]